MNSGLVEELEIDFWFIDSGGRLIIAGWSDAVASTALFSWSGGEVPGDVFRFRRADLRTMKPLGYIAVFPVGQIEPSSFLGVVLGNAFRSIPEGSLDGLRNLVESGVDECFGCLLSLIARGVVALEEDADIMRLVTERLSNSSVEDVETPNYALAHDDAIMLKQGAGISAGWFLPALGSSSELSGLLFCNDRAIAAHMELKAGARPDLEGYGNRYEFSGHDAWGATYNVGFSETTNAQCCLIVEVDGEFYFQLKPVTVDPSHKVVERLGNALALVSNEKKRKALLNTFWGNLDRTLPNAQQTWSHRPPQETAYDKTIILADLDFDGHFLPDLLLTAMQKLSGYLHVYVVGDENDEVTSKALLKFTTEMRNTNKTEEVRISFIDRMKAHEAWGRIKQQDTSRLIVARASVLLHALDSGSSLQEGTTPYICLPDARLTAAKSTPETSMSISTDQMLKTAEPFVFCGSTENISDLVQSSSVPFLTLERTMQFVSAAISPEKIDVKMLPTQGLIYGQSGGNNTPLGTFFSAYSYDADLLKALGGPS